MKSFPGVGAFDHLEWTYSGIPISQTSRGNANWFEKSGVREIEGGIKLRLIGRVLCLVVSKCLNCNKNTSFLNVDIDLYLQTKRT